MNAAPSGQVEALRFARQWAEDWNKRDLASILLHYDTAVVFHSPVAASMLGSSRVEGLQNLRAYWEKALQKIQDLHFEIVKVFYDSEEQHLLILYKARLSGETRRVCERLVFNATGLIIEAEALYGAVTDAGHAGGSDPGRA